MPYHRRVFMLNLKAVTYIIYYILLLLLAWLLYAKAREDYRERKIGSARPTAAGYVYEEYNLEKYVREMSCTPLSKADCDEQKRAIRECGRFGGNHCQIVNDNEFLRCVDSRDKSVSMFDCMKFARQKSNRCTQEWNERCGSR
jgi:hypothetical protein